MTIAHIELSEYHRLIKEVSFLRGENAALKSVVEKFTSTNIARDEICAPCSQETSYINEMVFIASGFKFCPWCGRKLSPVA